MRKLYFLFLFSALAIQAFAQTTYLELPVQDRHWLVIGTTPDQNNVPSSIYSEWVTYIDGDTVIAGNTYQKVWQHGNSGGSTVSHVGSIRQDSGIVYAYNTLLGYETVLYDFTLEVGDTAYADTASTSGTDFWYVVEAVTFPSIAGATRKQIDISRYDANGPTVPSIGASWLEGIGELSGGVFRAQWYDYLVCVKDGNQSLYSKNFSFGGGVPANLELFGCDEFVSTEGPLLPAESSLKLFPNPTADQLTVQLPVALDATVVVTDMQGRKVLELNEQTQQQIQLNLSDLRQGMYLLQASAPGYRWTHSFQVVR